MINKAIEYDGITHKSHILELWIFSGFLATS